MWDAKELGSRGGKIGGKSNSSRKQSAARVNGAKGGRPRKKPGVNATINELRAYHAQFAVKNTERVLETARVFPNLYPFNERKLRATLIRKGRRDLWLRLKALPQPEYGLPKTYESYLKRMEEFRIKPVSRTEWESWQKTQS